MVKITAKYWILLACITLLFLAVSCTGVYRTLGFTEKQAAVETAKDQEKLAEAIEQGRTVFWQLATAVIGAAGAILSGLLGKWLKTERNITQVLIRSIEKPEGDSIKKTALKNAVDADVAGTLHKRVKAITT